MKKIPLIKPFINRDIKQRVLDVLDSGYLTEGLVTREFENVFAEFTKSKHAIAVSSCTTGLEIALRALGIGSGDEVIVPDYTYPATASVVPIVGAHCVIVGVNPSNMLIDYDAIEKAITPKTKAIIPVSLFGNPLDYERLNKIKGKNNLYIIEDAACSIGAEYMGNKVGTQADISVFSLHPRKFITTGEGGMITTENTEWAKWMNSYMHFGMNMNNTVRKGVVFEMVGTNYKLSNIQSAIGLGQMMVVDELLEKRKYLADRYTNILKPYDRIKLPSVISNGKHSFQSYCVMTPSRDRIMNTLRPMGVEVQIGTYSLHLHPAFQNKQLFTVSSDMKGSITAFNECLTLPLFHELNESEQDFVISNLVKLL